VAGATPGLLFNAKETVAGDTPAMSAICLILDAIAITAI
jgi:hypothetical protein